VEDDLQGIYRLGVDSCGLGLRRVAGCCE